MNLKNAFVRIGMLALAVTMLGGTAAAAESDSGAFVGVEGGRIWYQTCGAGPKTMVLIHDGLLHSATWDEVWPILCKDYHVVRYDRRGFGRSPAATVSYSPVDDLSAVMHAAGFGHAMLVASSAGGGLAVDFTLQHPEAVDRLILSGPAISGLRYSQYFDERVGAMWHRIQQGDLDGALKGSWSFAPGHDAARKRTVAILTANPQDLNHLNPARLAPEAKPLLPSIKAPTLILIGEYDVADNQGQAGAAEALIPGSSRFVVRDTGHLMYLEHPDVFARLIMQFVNAKPHPDREASLRRHIESLEKGTPNYDNMTPHFAAEVRQQLPQVLDLIKSLGALRAINFAYSTETGADVYLATFEHRKAEWTMGPLSADGKVEMLDFRVQ